MKRYLKYQAKDSIAFIAVATLISLIIYIAIIMIQGLEPRQAYYNEAIILLRSLNLNYFPIILIILTTIIPIRQTNYLKNKRLNDLYLGLPINRTKLLITNLIIGFVQLLIIFTIVYWLGFLVVVTNFSQHYDVINLFNVLNNTNFTGYHYQFYIPLYLVLVGMALIPYIIFSFIYLKGNNSIDGIIIYGLYIAATLMLVGSIMESLWFNGIYQRTFMIECYLPYSPMFLLTKSYSNVIELGRPIANINPLAQIDWFNFGIPVVFFTVVSIVFVILIVLFEKNRKNENIDQITNNYFGYKTMIPISTFLTFLFLGLTNDLFMSYLTIILAIVYLLLYMVYQKTIKIHYKYYIMWIIMIVAGSLIGYSLYSIWIYSTIQNQ